MSIVLPVNDDPRFRVYTASASQTVFAVPFVFQSALDVSVFREVNNEWVLISSGYTITGADNPAGGTLTFSAGRTAGERILVLGKALLERLTSIVKNGRFASGPLDDEIDRLTMIAQELARDAERAVKAEYGSTGLEVSDDIADGQTLIKDGNRFVPGPSASLMEAIPGYAASTQSWRNQAEAYAQQAAADRVQTGMDRVQTGLDRAATRAYEQNVSAMIIFAGAPLVYALETPVPANGTKVALHTEAGLQGYQVEGGAWVMKGWIGKVDFTTVEELLASTFTLGATSTRIWAEGHQYSVAAVLEANPDVITAGGVKLFVLPGSNGSYNSDAFGVPKDLTDAYPAIQKAISAVSPTGVLVIPGRAYALSGTPTIPLANTDTRFAIYAYGAEFRITGANCGLARERPASISNSYTRAKIFVNGLRVLGDKTTGQHGFRFFTTYGLTLRDCDAEACDIGYCTVFGLMSIHENCFATNNKTYGFLWASGGSQIDFGSGAETAITGGNYSNSNSNGSVGDRCRVFSNPGALAHFKAEACEMVLRSPIAEGASPVNCFEYDNHGSAQSKGITIQEPHVECTPSNAVYKFHSSTGTFGGTYIIDGQDTVITTGGWTGYMLDIGTNLSEVTIKIVNNKTLFNVTNLVKGVNSGALPRFVVDTMNPAHLKDPTRWESGIPGNVATQAPSYDLSNNAYTLLTRSSHFIEGAYQQWDSTSGFVFNAATGNFDINLEAVNRSLRVTAAGTNEGLILDGRLFLRDAVSVASPTLGTLQGRIPVYNKDKTLIGYAPLYSTIT